MDGDLDSKTKLKRFCYLGSLEATYLHRKGLVDVPTYFSLLCEIYKTLSAEDFVAVVKETLGDETLARRDDSIFAYAAYLSSSVNDKNKVHVRREFNNIIKKDMDLFLFARYHLTLRELQKQHGFSHAVLNGIKGWYKALGYQGLCDMWLERRSAYGISHKYLMQRCHINDADLGGNHAGLPFFRTCTELLKASEGKESSPVKTEAKIDAKDRSAKVLIAESNDNATPVALQNGTNGDEPTDSNEPLKKEDEEKPKASAEVPSDVVLSMSKLRTTNNKWEALKIVRKFKLKFHQVPPKQLRFTEIVEALLPSMTPLEVLNFWAAFGRNHHLTKNSIMAIIKQKFENVEELQKYRLHPVVILLQMDQIGVSRNLTEISFKKRRIYQMEYLKALYEKSFERSPPNGLRIHVTLNLAKFYKTKRLKNLKKLTYFEAAVALAFGYFKREENVDVFRWFDKSLQLAKIELTKDMDIHSAMSTCELFTDGKNSQRLISPITNAMSSHTVYDLFLTIVPTSGRGNPGQSSEFLAKFINRYRETKNPKAKYVIVDLLKFRKSMFYPRDRNQHLMHIFGLDEKTTTLIDNFACERFE